MREHVDQLFVETEARNDPVVGRVIQRFPSAEVSYCDPADRSTVVEAFRRAPRRGLFLKRHRGAFLKPFPRHPWYDRGGGVYYSLILGYNCFGSCHYCFIQSIFPDAVPTLYVNAERMLDELRRFLRNDPRAWISTGEYIDSFQLDETTRYTEAIMDVMREFPESTLELRTKSGRVDHLPADPPVRARVAYSVSPEAVVAGMEPGTASLDRRLAKAKLLHEKGYAVDIRIDPVIPTTSFVGAYADLPADIERQLSWSRVSRAFLGALRFDEGLLRKLAASTAARRLLDAEYVRCPDGKYRASRHDRTAVYRRLVDGIRAYRPDIDITIMMEPAYIRRAVLSDPRVVR
jgi:DNA repair photolyase